MALKLGTTDVNKVYLGSTDVQKVYLGTTEVWSAASPVTFDAISTGAVGANATSFNDSITIAADATAAVFWLSIWTPTVTRPSVSVTLGGSSMTEHATLRFRTDGAFYSEHLTAFRLLNPPTGANKTVAVTTGSGVYYAIRTVSYKNVTAFGTAVTNSAANSSATVTVSSAANHMAVNGFSGDTTNFTAYNQTTRANIGYVSGQNPPTLIGDAAGASSVTFTATTATAWGGIAIDLS